jgi:hypothetical protein
LVQNSDDYLVLYHGTNCKIDEPSLEKCPKNGREFGQAFYLTENIEIAKRYGENVAQKEYSKNYYLHKYTLEKQFLCCRLVFTEKECEMWEKFVNGTMKGNIDVDFCRAVIGPIKDRSIRKVFGNNFVQYALKTQHILDHLKLEACEKYKTRLIE